MKIFIFLLALSNICNAQIVILHEKFENQKWVLATKWLQSPSEIETAINAIEADPNQRKGDKILIVGGVRLNLAPVTVELPDTWTSTDANSGKIIVFWNAVGSQDPADWHYEMFNTIAGAEQFINDVKNDPTRELWDQRPFYVQETWVNTKNERIEFIITP